MPIRPLDLTYTFRLPPKLMRAIKRCAADAGQRPSQYVRTALLAAVLTEPPSKEPAA